MKLKLILVSLAVISLAGGVWWWQSHSGADTDQPSANTTATGFNKSQHSLDDPNSIWVIVNKLRPLPEKYLPTDLVVPNVKLGGSPLQELMHLRAEAAKALEELSAGAKQAGLELMLFSGYRTPEYQKQLYDNYVALNGQLSADQFSARPHFSEHQTGLALDLSGADGKCQAETCFAKTAEAAWLAAHAHEYGFIIRYLENKEGSTGYKYEPWHLRYVGKELAAEIARTGQTLEEFFGLQPAPNYKP